MSTGNNNKNTIKPSDGRNDQQQQQQQQQHQGVAPDIKSNNNDDTNKSNKNNSNVDNNVSSSEEQRQEESSKAAVQKEQPLLLLGDNDNAPLFYYERHIHYIINLASKLDLRTSYEGAVTEHLRVSGVYWSLTALYLITSDNTVMNRDMKLQTVIVDWVFTCYDTTSGGFGGNTGQDGHLLYTLSALQVLALADRLTSDERLTTKRQSIINFIKSLQKSDGSFAGDRWGEIDTRFTYCALSSLALLGVALDNDDTVNIDAAAHYILRCRNFDGGFGSCIGAESHAGQIFCCIGALAIAQRLHWLHECFDNDTSVLGWWLCERQCDSGGLNGRPEKQADVCYSWWIVSAMSIIGKLNWINTKALARFILNCQDCIDGGIADRPNDMADVFHTFFGIAGLSLLGFLVLPSSSQFRQIDPIYALPTDIVQQLQLPGQILRSKEDTETDNNPIVVDSRLAQYNIFYTD